MPRYDESIQPNNHHSCTSISYCVECNGIFVTKQHEDKTVADRRKGLCFNVVRQGECYNPGDMLVTKSMCCCSMFAAARAQAVGWGNECELCPRVGSREHELLCVDSDPGTAAPS